MATDLTDNGKKLRQPCNPNKPLESLYIRLNKCLEYATAAGKTITEVQVVYITYDLFAETRKFQEYCRAWRAKSDPENTLNKFQAYFIETKSDLRKRQQISHQGRYRTGTANNTMEMSMSFDNLEHAMAEDCAVVKNLTTENSTLTK